LAEEFVSAIADAALHNSFTSQSNGFFRQCRWKRRIESGGTTPADGDSSAWLCSE
jgi:hypothetical protein